MTLAEQLDALKGQRIPVRPEDVDRWFGVRRAPRSEQQEEARDE